MRAYNTTSQDSKLFYHYNYVAINYFIVNVIPSKADNLNHIISMYIVLQNVGSLNVSIPTFCNRTCTVNTVNMNCE